MSFLESWLKLKRDDAGITSVEPIVPSNVLEAAHKQSFKNRVEVEKSKLCACFYCFSTFPPDDIEEWVDDDLTAICPSCGIDSVIGDASGVDLSKDFLLAMYNKYFD